MARQPRPAARFRGALAWTIALLLPLALACGPGDAGESDEAGSDRATPTMGSSPIPEGAEGLSLLGEPLVPPTPSEAALETHGQALAEAEAALAENPTDADARIWAGRQLAYLGRYGEAIAQFTLGIADHPDDPRFYRHRGHRFITLRQFSDAVADFDEAAALVMGTEDEIEPDGLPNAAGIPLSTLQFNIWYHKGLAHYLLGDLEAALAAWEACMDVSVNPDLQVATSHWLYMTLRELGRDEEAAAVLEPITPDMDIIENAAYHDLLLLYRGERAPEDLLGDEPSVDSSNAAVVYGVGNWYRYTGNPARGYEIFEWLVDGSDQWAAFGYIAAEAKLAARPGAD